jgi:hypothetical protein
VGVSLWLRHGARRGLLGAAALAGAAVLVLAPWTVYASTRAGELVPVTRGDAAALFVGTYLPGNGTTVGFKRTLGRELQRRDPRLRRVDPIKFDAGRVLDLVAERRPELSRDAAIRSEAYRNIRRYALGHPLSFARMMLNKVSRMWLRYGRGGSRHTSPWVRGWHIALAVAALLGLLAGIRRTLDPVLVSILAALAWSTALHTLVVSQGRYNLPLMPVLIAGGVAGFVLARRAGGLRLGPPGRRAPAAGERAAATEVPA